MNHKRRGVAVLTGAATAVAALGAAAPSLADEMAPSRVTVRASADTVSSGEQFRLRGRVTSEGDALADATVRVKTFRNGEWVRLRGAVVSTNDEGRYRVRIILQMKGERQLRVVANPEGDDIRTARKDIVVTVK